MKVAVIGAGSMGHQHARVYADLPDIDLVAVADPNGAAAEAVCRRHGGRPYTDHRRMLKAERPDAVSIAVPTVHHCDVAMDVFGCGVHALVEKPIALSIDEGQRMIAAAEQAGACLMVGHVERFNPAVLALKDRLQRNELGRVFQIDTRRQGPFPARVTDVGVVIDLAVHDLDIISYVTRARVVRVFAETERRIHSAYEDLLSGLLRLDDGTVGSVTVNWLTPTKIRELSVIGERGMFRVDYLTQDLYFFENATATHLDWDSLQALRGVSEGWMMRHAVAKREPLRAELEAFLAAVRGQRPVLVTGWDGLNALSMAHTIVTSGQEHRVVTIHQRRAERGARNRAS